MKIFGKGSFRSITVLLYMLILIQIRIWADGGVEDVPAPLPDAVFDREAAITRATTINGWNKLTLAIAAGNADEVIKLLKSDQSFPAADSAGRTYLDIAKAYGHPELENLLLQKFSYGSKRKLKQRSLLLEDFQPTAQGPYLNTDGPIRIEPLTKVDYKVSGSSAVRDGQQSANPRNWRFEEIEKRLKIKANFEKRVISRLLVFEGYRDAFLILDDDYQNEAGIFVSDYKENIPVVEWLIPEKLAAVSWTELYSGSGRVRVFYFNILKFSEDSIDRVFSDERQLHWRNGGSGIHLGFFGWKFEGGKKLRIQKMATSKVYLNEPEFQPDSYTLVSNFEFDWTGEDFMTVSAKVKIIGRVGSPLIDVAEKFGVSIAEIRELNPEQQDTVFCDRDLILAQKIYTANDR